MKLLNGTNMILSIIILLRNIIITVKTNTNKINKKKVVLKRKKKEYKGKAKYIKKRLLTFITSIIL